MLRRKKVLLAVCIAAMLSGSMAVAGGAAEPTAPAPGPAESQPGEEIVSLRTQDSRTFRTEDPEVLRKRVWAEPVHYRSAGKWVTIDTRLTAGRAGFLKNAANAFGLEIAQRPSPQEFLRFDHGGGLTVGWGALGARRPAKVTVSSSSVSLSAVWPNVDVEFLSTATGLKEDLVLQSAAAQREFVFPLTITGGTARLSTAGQLEILDSSGAVRAVVPHGYMTDSAGPGLVGAESFGVTYELIPTAQGQQALRVRLDNAWLDDPARVWPVRVDPNYLFYQPGSDSDDTYTAQSPEGERSLLPVLAIGHSAADPAGRFRRAYLHFSGAPAGVDVTEAILRVRNPAGLAGCTTATMQVHRITAGWNGNAVRSFTNGAPGTLTAADGTGSSPCGSGGETSFYGANLTATVKGWANGSVTNNGLMIRAANETNLGAFNYREFRSANGGGTNVDRPYLEIFFNSKPAVPEQLAPASGSQTSLTPTLSGTFESSLDEDTGKLYFEVYDNATGTLTTSGWGPTFVGQDQTSSWNVPVGALTAGHTYKWRAVAMDDRGASGPWSSYRTFTANAGPNTPTNLDPADGASVIRPVTLSAQFSTSAGTGSGFVRFRLYTASGSLLGTYDGTTVASGGTSTYTLSNATVAVGSSYRWSAQAVNAAGQTSATTPQRAFTVSAVLAPQNPQATPGDGSALVQWAPPSSGPAPDSYRVAAYTSAGTFIDQQTVPAAAPAAFFDGLANGTSYYFRIYSRLSGAESAPAQTPTITPELVLGQLVRPTNVQAVRGDTQAMVTWTKPTLAVDGTTSYQVQGYRASDNAPVGNTVTTTATSATVTALKNGTPVYFQVKAMNLLILGFESAPSNTVTPAGPPFAPVNIAASPGDRNATVSWEAPPERSDGTPGDNGDPITSYTVTASPGGAQQTTSSGAARSVVFTGLKNGTSYTFTVRATNGVAPGELSAESNAVVPFGRPFAPVGASATPGNQRATVSWEAPPAQPDGTPGNNGRPITSYVVTASPGGAQATADEASGSAVVVGLDNGTAYTFRVQAVSSGGVSDPSSPTNSVIPAGPPSAPTNLVVTTGAGSLYAEWQPSHPNGAAVTYVLTAESASHVVESDPTSETSAALSGLTNGVDYQVYVTATNWAGSTRSAGSVSAVPRPDAPGSATATPGNARVTVTWTPSPGTSASARYRLTGTPDVEPYVTAPGDTSHTFTGLTNWTSYRFTVQAIDGGAESPSVNTESVTPKPTRARDLLVFPDDSSHVFFEIPTWQGHGVTRLQGFIDDTNGEPECFGPQWGGFCSKGDGRTVVDTPAEVANYNISARARIVYDHEYGEGTVIVYATHDTDGTVHPAEDIEFTVNPSDRFDQDGWPNEVGQLTQGEFEGTATLVYHLINSMMSEEVARSGGPAVNGAFKVSQGSGSGVAVKIGARPFPSFEVIRDLNGHSTLAWSRAEEGGSENLMASSTDYEFNA